MLEAHSPLQRALPLLPLLLALPWGVIAQACCQEVTSDARSDNPTDHPHPPADYGTAPPERLQADYLPNAFRLHPRVISGGQPEGDQGFRVLASLGVKTVISVDSALPDVVTARRIGLRYVHLPHGYDGIPDSRVRELAKAVRDLEGPIYIHCHHGKHRSPAAAAVACAALGYLEPSNAESVLLAAGTNAAYRGLFASVREARRIDEAVLDRFPVDFVEVAQVTPLAEAMVAMERAFDRLSKCSELGWLASQGDTDRPPAYEALLLREHYTELLRIDPAVHQPAEFRRMLNDGETASIELELALTSKDAESEVSRLADQALQRIRKNCIDCHAISRDVPIGEKPD